MLDLNIFLSISFFLSQVLSFVALTNFVFLYMKLYSPNHGNSKNRETESGGCILPWCPVQCVLHFWTNKLID